MFIFLPLKVQIFRLLLKKFPSHFSPFNVFLNVLIKYILMISLKLKTAFYILWPSLPILIVIIRKSLLVYPSSFPRTRMVWLSGARW